MTAGASRAAPTIAPQPALAPSPQPRPAPTARALPPGLVEQGGQNWTPIGGQICTPIDSTTDRNKAICALLTSVSPRHSAATTESAMIGRRIILPPLSQSPRLRGANRALLKRHRQSGGRALG